MGETTINPYFKIYMLLHWLLQSQSVIMSSLLPAATALHITLCRQHRNEASNVVRPFPHAKLPQLHASEFSSRDAFIKLLGLPQIYRHDEPPYGSQPWSRDFFCTLTPTCEHSFLEISCFAAESQEGNRMKCSCCR